MKKVNFLILSAFLIFHLFFLINLQFTAWPEMFSYPFLRNNGFVFYRDFIFPYPPLLVNILSLLFSVFGYQLIVLKIFTWFLILLNDLLIFLILKKIVKKELYLLLGLGLYVLLQPFLEGNMLWFDLAIVTPLLLGTLFLLKEKESRNLILAGIFLGLACLIKQTAGLFLVLGFVFLLIQKTKIKNLGFFLLGPLILGSVLLISLLSQGIFSDFLNWVFIFPMTFWSKFPGYVQMKLSPGQLMIVPYLLVPLLVLIILSFKQREVWKEGGFLLLVFFLMASLLAIYPRFSFFHCQSALAFLALAFGYALEKFQGRLAIGIIYFFVLAIGICLPVIIRDWGKEIRFLGSRDLKLAQIISERVGKEEKIFLLGPHSALYVFSDRLPPKPWTDNFGWYLEIPGVQEGILERWENSPPEYILWQDPKFGDWYTLAVYQPKQLTQWIEDNYQQQEEIQTKLWLWQKKD